MKFMNFHSVGNVIIVQRGRAQPPSRYIGLSWIIFIYQFTTYNKGYCHDISDSSIGYSNHRYIGYLALGLDGSVALDFPGEC